MGAVSAAEIVEPIDAGGDMDVPAAALLAGRKGLPREAPFDGRFI
jgi:hypothetical protein